MTLQGWARGARGPASPRAAALWLLQFGLAFAFLNALLTFENRWPGFGVQAAPRLSFELCLAVAGLIGWVSCRGRPGPKAVLGLALGFVLLVGWRYVDVTAPAVLGRPVNVYWDGRHGLDLLSVALGSLTRWQVAFAAGLFAGGTVALLLAVRLAIATLARCLAWPGPRPWMLALVAALALSFAAYVPGGRDTRWFFSLPLAPTLKEQAVLMSRVLWPSHGEAVLGPSPGFDTGLEGLNGAQGAPDVLLIFAESYGASAYDLPEVHEALAGPRAELQKVLSETGRGVVSARVRSPTFGGSSWLAHASLLSGLPMTDPGHHDLLLASRRPTLVSHFARHGYRTVGWMPGLKRAWPEGAFYGFDDVVDDRGMGYEGPDFGYWRIPDQLAMARLHQRELDRPTGAGPQRAPRFVVFPTISTHAPFHPLAPHVDDWARLEGPSPYTAAEAAAALATPLAVQRPLPNHIASLRYQFQWLSAYLGQRAARPLVLVLVGDHQPPGLVSGSGASWDVPVHVFSSDPAWLKRLQVEGFAEGLQPSVTSLGAMHELTAVLLRVFDRPPPVGPQPAGEDPGVTCQACTSPDGASRARSRSHARIASADMP